MNILLVGHRCVGKSTVGAHLAEHLGRRHADLDALIEQASGETCSHLVATDEPAFRALELSTLAHVLAENDDIVVSAGAGLCEIPAEPLVVWLDRDGWPDTALIERARLQSDLDWPEEVAWMCTTREPRWLAAAHLHVETPRGRSPQRVARDLATLIRWAEAPSSELASKTWVVPATPAELGRATRDAARFGLAGVEVRSDVFPQFEELTATYLASIRTDDVRWIEHAAGAAAAFDVDLANLETFLGSGVLTSTPRPLTLSLHPSAVDPEDVMALAAAVRRLQLEHPGWSEQLAVKYAPQVRGFADIGLGRAAIAPLMRTRLPVTYLPQGAEFAWIRPILATTNATNYVAARMRPDRAGLGGPSRTPWDIQDWLPHLVGPGPTRWDVLIGEPVEHSQGDLWHRRAALERGERTGYVKVRVPAPEFDAALDLLAELDVRGVSVTSPLKNRAAFICPDDAVFGELLTEDDRWAAAKAEAPIRTGNTLVRHDGRWLVTDTDEAGMAASLAWFEERELGPATIALFGGGGVRAALIRAIEASDWFLVFKCRSRDGWGPDKPPFVTLVVNAGGADSTSHDGHPRSRGWLDMHYKDVDEPPDSVVHLAGDVFFDAQAAAQRAFWRDY